MRNFGSDPVLSRTSQPTRNVLEQIGLLIGLPLAGYSESCSNCQSCCQVHGSYRRSVVLCERKCANRIAPLSLPRSIAHVSSIEPAVKFGAACYLLLRTAPDNWQEAFTSLKKSKIRCLTCVIRAHLYIGQVLQSAPEVLCGSERQNCIVSEILFSNS